MRIKRKVWLAGVLILSIILVIILFTIGNNESEDEIPKIPINETESQENASEENITENQKILNKLSGAITTSSEELPSKDELETLKNLGVEIIYVELYDYWSSDSRQNEGVQKKIENLAKRADELNIKLILAPVTGPGKNSNTFEIYSKKSKKTSWEFMLRDLVQNTESYSSVIGWSIMGKPNPEEYFGNFEEEYELSIEQWENLTARFINAVREENTEGYILISPILEANYKGLKYLNPVQDEKIIYDVYFDYPDDYLEQEEPAFNEEYETDERDSFKKEDIEEEFQEIIDFTQKTNDLILVHYGGVRYVPGMRNYIEDLLEIMEENNIDNAYYLWSESSKNEYNLLYGENPYNDEVDAESPLAEKVIDSWN
jgi:hypothetical protein